MAAYAATVTAPDNVAKKLAATGLGILRGTVNLSNYNSTLAEITGITGKFRSAPTVLLGGASSNGYIVAWDTTGKAVKAFYPTKAVTPAGSVAAPTFTGTTHQADLDLATPVFSGTGLTASGQAITTTDNQTMTLNQCAGMWLMAATVTAPALEIVSNTAVNGAPAVFTVKGVAATDAGAYKVVTTPTITGTNSAPAFTGTAVAGQAGTEVANDVNVGTVSFVAFGPAP